MPNQSPQGQINTPKADAVPVLDASPPPYSASRMGGLAAGPSRALYASQLNAQPGQRFYTRPIAVTMSTEDQDDGESTNAFSSLHLRINTSINISKNNNLVCLTESPATHANAIAEAVSEAMQKHSSGNCGIPMIDGDGNPRPIKVEVDAGMVIDGMGNVVGNEKVIDEVIQQRAEIRRQDLRRSREDNDKTESVPEPSPKRRRSE
jgi:hypothetical protein